MLRICVSTCSINPIYYGDTVSWTCLPQCPSGSFGNPLNQQCVYNFGSISTCPVNYFADSTSGLCVKNCPMKYDLYADSYYKKCMPSCYGGLFTDNSTMKCVTRCP